MSRGCNVHFSPIGPGLSSGLRDVADRRPSGLLRQNGIRPRAPSRHCAAFAAQLFPEAPHVRIHRAGVDHGFIAPDIPQQSFARLHPPPPLRQHGHQLEFGGGQGDRLAGHQHLMARQVNDHAGGVDAFSLDFGPFGLAAEQTLDAQDQFPGAEGLGDIVVGANSRPSTRSISPALAVTMMIGSGWWRPRLEQLADLHCR